MSLWGELKRRKVVRVAVAYAIVGWLLAQIAALTFPVLLLPDVVLRAFVVLVILGFPIALLLAWAYQLMPDGPPQGSGSTTASALGSTAGGMGGRRSSSLGIAAAAILGLLIGATSIRFLIPPPVVVAQPKTPVQLTANPAEDSVVSAAISPDGRYLAFGDGTGLHLRLIQTGDTHAIELPADMNVGTTEIDWMPDGASLIFTASRGGISGLWRIPMLGGAPQLLRERAWRAAVAPDGGQIAYLVDRPAHGILLMNAEGGNVRELIDLGVQSVWEIGWSPDARQLVFGVIESDFVSTHLDAIDADGRNRRSLIANPDLFQDWRGHLPFYWARDNRLFYAERNPPPGTESSNLKMVSLDAATGMPSGAAVTITNLTGYNFKDLSMTADGSRLAFLLETNQSDVYVGDVAAGNTRLDAIRRVSFDDRMDSVRGWADASTLLMASARGLGVYLYRQHVAEREPESVSTAPSGDGYARASPDGRWLLSWRIDADDKVLVRQPFAGGAAEEVLRRPATFMVEFDCPDSVDVSPDCVLGAPARDGQFVFTAFNPVYGIGAELASVVNHPPFAQWALSPDGGRIALVHNTGPARIIDLADGSERELSRPGWALGEFVDWSQDGQGLFMDGQNLSGFFRKALVYTPIDTNETYVLRREPNQWHVRPRTSPDGSKLAFDLMIFSGNAWMIENP